MLDIAKHGGSFMEVIDFDRPEETFPDELRNWDSDFENYIKQNINVNDTTEWWDVRQQLWDLNIDRNSIVQNFVASNMDAEIAVCHVTRLLDTNTVFQEGLWAFGGSESLGEKRIRDTLVRIGAKEDCIAEILEHANYYWNRDKESRKESIHFMIDMGHVYREKTACEFAANLGGEILRWSLEGVDKGLYKQEPYKKLWLEGTPSIVKFKVKLKNILDYCRDNLIAEILNYSIVRKIYDLQYEFDCTGMTTGAVPAEDIISISEIKGFVDIQKKYDEYKDFYE